MEPPPIVCPCAVFDIAFHPRSDVLAVALVDGTVSLFGVSRASAPKPLASSSPHAASIRSLRFSADGESLLCASADGAVSQLDASGAAVWRGGTSGASTPVNVVEPLGAGSVFAAGDESGAVKIWDARAAGGAGARPVTFEKQEDVITALLWDAARGTLLAASGDGTLGVYDLRKAPGKLAALTAPDGEELLSLAALKGGALAVAGTQDGVLLSWDWGAWGDESRGVGGSSKRFAGHPESIDALLVVDDDTLVTGSSDGLIRLVTVAPNKLVGIIGEHGDDDDPVERLAWSRDRTIIASTGHDDTVRFWDVAYLFEDDEEDGGGGASSKKRFVDLPALPLPRAGSRVGDGDDDDEEEDWDDDDFAADGDGDEMNDSGGAAGGGRAPRSAREVGAKKGRGGKAKGGGAGGGPGAHFDGLD
jgi:WD40 repeat protein